MKDFRGHVAAITGAASGMGRSLAERLAREGCHLALSDVEEVGLAETAASARAHGVRVAVARVDVADRVAVEAWAADVVREFGKVNLIFNNAGVAVGATCESVEHEDFSWVMNINFWGVVHGTQAFLPHLRASGDGHVVNTSSLFGLVALPGVGTYNASKFAVRGFTEALRMDLEMSGAPVTATCVHPGGVRTNIARAGRMHHSVTALGRDPEDVRTRFDRLLSTTSADEAARQILEGVRRRQRRVIVGWDAWAVDLFVRALGSWYQPVVVFVAKTFLKRAG